MMLCNPFWCVTNSQGVLLIQVYAWSMPGALCHGCDLAAEDMEVIAFGKASVAATLTASPSRPHILRPAK
eukprot:352178-Chlamydomonas_euryale.AAC.2